MLSKEVASTIFKVFGMTQPGIEPMSPGSLGEHSTNKANELVVKYKNCFILEMQLVFSTAPTDWAMIII